MKSYSTNKWKKEKGKKLDKRRSWIISESDSRPMHSLEKKVLKKEAKAKVFESVLTDFERERERERES